MAAIEDDGGTNTTTNGTLSNGIYTTCWPEGGMANCASCRSPFLRKIRQCAGTHMLQTHFILLVSGAVIILIGL